MIQFIRTRNFSIFPRKISILKGLNELYIYVIFFSIAFSFYFTELLSHRIFCDIRSLLNSRALVISSDYCGMGYEGNKGMWNSEGKPVVPDINLLH